MVVVLLKKIGGTGPREDPNKWWREEQIRIEETNKKKEEEDDSRRRRSKQEKVSKPVVAVDWKSYYTKNQLDGMRAHELDNCDCVQDFINF